MPPFSLKFKDNTPFDPVTGILDAEALRKTWLVCTKVANCLEQGDRLENLAWRLWHMERRNEDLLWSKAITSRSLGPALGQSDKGKGNEMSGLQPISSNGNGNRSEMIFQDQHHLQQTFVSQVQGETQSFSKPSMSLSGTSVMHAPQPRHIYSPLPPADWSQNPLMNNARSGEDALISTAPWGTLMDGQNNPAPQPPVLQFSHPPPFLAVSSSISDLPLLSNIAQSSSLDSPNNISHNYFALPPAYVAPSSAFYSSYGMYQPISGPYSRFLTPSPEPTDLGTLELDLVSHVGSFEKDCMSSTNGNQLQGVGDHLRRLEDENDELWTHFAGNNVLKEGGDRIEGNGGVDPFEGMNLAERSVENTPRNDLADSSLPLTTVEHGSNSFEQGKSTVTDQPPILPTLPRTSSAKNSAALPNQKDSVANANSIADAYFKRGTLKPSHSRSPSDVEDRVSRASSDTKQIGLTPEGERNASDEVIVDSNAIHFSKNPRKRSSTHKFIGNENSSSSGTSTPQASGLEGGAGAGAGGSVLAIGGKKNRNPHATQLPGNGTRKQPKVEAGEDHKGPVCSHCQSIATPLWRRGPTDELLCNACGLYVKLHNKPRPFKVLGKSALPRSGIIAQASASGETPTCANCHATSTPMWRKDAEGKLSCNACSLYYKLHQIVRPSSLSQKKRGSSRTTSANNSRASSPTLSQYETTPGKYVDILPRRVSPQQSTQSPQQVKADSLLQPQQPSRITSRPQSFNQLSSRLPSWPSPGLTNFAAYGSNSSATTYPRHGSHSPAPRWRGLTPDRASSPFRNASPVSQERDEQNDREESVAKRKRVDESWERGTPNAVRAGGAVGSTTTLEVTSTWDHRPPHSPQPRV